MELGNDIDCAHDVGVEFEEFIGGNPIFLVNSAANGFHFKSREIFGANPEPCYKAGLLRRVFGVPVAGNLCGVFLVKDWIKDRLAGKTRRELAEVGLANEFEFFGTDGAEEGGGFQESHRLNVKLMSIKSARNSSASGRS